MPSPCSLKFTGTSANRMKHRAFPLAALFLLVVPANGDIFMEFSNTTGEMSLELFNNITVTDRIQSYTCQWGNVSCYVECATVLNVTSNYTGSTGLSEDDKLDKVHSTAFNITAAFLDCEFTKCLPEPFTALLKRTQHQSHLEIKDMKRLRNMKSMCKRLFNNAEVKRVFIGAEKTLVKVVLAIPFEGEEIVYNMNDVALKVTKAKLSMNPSLAEKYTNVNAPLLSLENLNDTTPQIWIPTETIQKGGPMGVMVYGSPDLFLFNREEPRSQLIRVELPEGQHVLQDPLQMQFKIFNLSIDPVVQAFECQFYDEQAGEDASWSNRGCNTSIAGQHVLCSCDHMTPFAVLLVPAGKIDSENWKILSIISYVGTALSAFFSAVSILTYVVLRNPLPDHAGTIHVSLCSALFLLNVSFLLNESLARMNSMPLCMFVGLLMHYSLLCSFTWMAIEALQLYLLIIRVFNTYIHLYIAKLSVIGWGVPAVVIGIAFAFRREPNDFYGLEVITVGNTTSSLCWITDQMYFYGLNVSYFALIFLFNNGILLTVSVRISKMRSPVKKSGETIPWKQVCTVLGLTCLLGTTWGLGFLSYGPLSIPMQYLFCICNSLQGFFIFLWICRTSKRAKTEASSRSSS